MSVEGLVVANVALLSITDGQGRFLLIRHSETHRFASARGKLDLPNIEHPDYETPVEAVHRMTPAAFGLRLPDAGVQVLGQARNVAFYPDKSEWRDTRRVFIGATWPEVPERGFHWHTLGQAEEMQPQLRQPFFIEVLRDQHRRVGADHGQKNHYFMWDFYDHENEALSDFMKSHPWRARD